MLRRPRRRLHLAALGAMAALTCQTTSAFLPPALRIPVARPQSTVVLQAVPTSSAATKEPPVFRPTSSAATKEPPVFRPSAPARLTLEATQELLRQAVELRRLKSIREEHALKMRREPTSLILSRAAGYGDDLEAYETALEAGHRAREQLVTSNMGLVYHCVDSVLGKRRQAKSLSREDLVQEGAIGLARAVDRYNLEIGGRFSTYAYYWVRAAVLRCIAERDDVVRVPEHVSSAVRKVSKAAATLGIDIDGDDLLSSWSSAGWKEAQAAKALAEEAGLSERQFQEAIKAKRRRSSLSFEAWMQQGRDYTTDLAPTEPATESTVETELQTEHLRKQLSRFLRPKEMEALSWRYGLLTESSKPRGRKTRAEQDLVDMPTKGKWGEAMSFVEVGKKMQVSAEYGRRLVHAALEKLRQAAEEGALEPALLY